MKKYAIIVNDQTKECNIGLGTDELYYQSIGMTIQEVEEGYNENWYLKGYAPNPSNEEQRQMRANAYIQEVDPITAHIQRLKDESPVPEGEIAELIAERDARVVEIKERYPYHDEEAANG